MKVEHILCWEVNAVLMKKIRSKWHYLNHTLSSRCSSSDKYPNYHLFRTPP